MARVPLSLLSDSARKVWPRQVPAVVLETTGTTLLFFFHLPTVGATNWRGQLAGQLANFFDWRRQTGLRGWVVVVVEGARVTSCVLCRPPGRG